MLARAGGVLVTCDAVQNWAEVDAYFSAETGAAFAAAGLIRPERAEAAEGRAVAAAKQAARLRAKLFAAGIGPDGERVPLGRAAERGTTGQNQAGRRSPGGRRRRGCVRRLERLGARAPDALVRVGAACLQSLPNQRIAQPLLLPPRR